MSNGLFVGEKTGQTINTNDSNKDYDLGKKNGVLGEKTQETPSILLKNSKEDITAQPEEIEEEEKQKLRERLEGEDLPEGIIKMLESFRESQEEPETNSSGVAKTPSILLK